MKPFLACFLLLAAAPAWTQTARPVDGLSEQQRADYRKLLRGYVDTFRILGRAQTCRVAIDPAPFRREVAQRHGEKSDAVTVAELAFTAGAEDRPVGRAELEPRPSAPMPCDVISYMKGMRLPELPASLIDSPP